MGEKRLIIRTGCMSMFCKAAKYLRTTSKWWYRARMMTYLCCSLTHRLTKNNIWMKGLANRARWPRARALRSSRTSCRRSSIGMRSRRTSRGPNTAHFTWDIIQRRGKLATFRTYSKCHKRDQWTVMSLLAWRMCLSTITILSIISSATPTPPSS